MYRIAFALAALLALFQSAYGEDVVTLTGDNFSDAVKQHDKLVVEFYAPWCGHCKKLAPEYEKAAGKLKDEGIVLAKVDATEEINKKLASKFDVKGFPTLKVFRGDESAPGEYEGPREADGIVSFLRKEFGPATAELTTAEEVEKARNPADDVVVLGVFKDAASPAFAAFKATAEAMRNDVSFKHVFKPELVTDAGGEDAVFVHKTFDDLKAKFDGKFEQEHISAFINKVSTPRLVALDRSNVNKKALQAMFADDKPKLLGAMPAGHADLAAFKETLISIKEAKSGIHVLYMDPAENAGALNFFGLSAEDTPALLVHEPASNAKFNSGVLALDKLTAWVDDYLAGKIEKTIKSEAVPESNDGPVKVVVAKQFDEIVMSGKDVLIEFYAPWCGHCKKLAPVYDELGEFYKDKEGLVIAKMDATANDVPNSKFEVHGFPTLYFVSGGEVKKYEGGRGLEDFKKYLSANAKSLGGGADEL